LGSDPGVDVKKVSFGSLPINTNSVADFLLKTPQKLIERMDLTA
jgi:hypothetical protein